MVLATPPEPHLGAIVPASQDVMPYLPDLLSDIDWSDFGDFDLARQSTTANYQNQNLEIRRNDWVNFNPSFSNCSVNITFNTTK